MSDPDHRAEVIKRAETEGRKAVGQPGVESASGRDRSHGELQTNLGTNQNDADIDAIAPSRGTVEGSRVGPSGDPTGSTDE